VSKLGVIVYKPACGTKYIEDWELNNTGSKSETEAEVMAAVAAA
jgi:hypothetical protein